ncbi:MAG TPA: TRAP transporter small permease subunit [Deltaproteobacteria bacterium]|nr:TRAP transporter small permease subunit [Deltaproteobacteria bacterium]HIJ39998.1 TRAP transporter small permease subunit [Deltaproteobacteria bacterium]HIJ40861.1 TRAP transporter small permease subunit [Deltaproteobacteria bacterium]
MQLKTFLKGLDTISEWTGRIFVWLIIPLTAVVVFEVISTKFFDRPHVWAPEITDYIYGPYFMLVAAYTLLYKGHVCIDIISQKFSPRVRGILDCFTYLVFFFPFCIIMLHQGYIYTEMSWLMHETSPTAELSIVPQIKAVIPITFALLLIQGLSNLIKAFLQAVKGREI